MGLRERITELVTADDVDQFIAKYPNCALFKAGGCHKTMQGFGYVEQVLDARDALPMGFVRVVENREASNHVANLLKIIHESPQFIILKDGKPVYDVDNWDISPESLETPLLKHFGPVTSEGVSRPSAVNNVEPYIELLQDFIGEKIDEERFAEMWLSKFQLDSTLRSTEEFTLLNSLFGDVDLAIMEADKAQDNNSKSLIMRAKTLLNQITSR